MKKQTLLLTLLLVTVTQAFSQINFEKGYLINEDGQKIECLIKNIDWHSNPTKFEYKMFADSTAFTASITTVKEFAINEGSKYVRATVQIDRSPGDLENMSSKKEPQFLTEQLFLKVLIEGAATLYQYTDGNLVRYFYKVRDMEIRQLVHKSYLIGINVATNNSFRQQIFADLKCPEIALKDIEALRYVKRYLMLLFSRYNECTNSAYTNFERKEKKDLFNLSLRPGLNYSKLGIYSADLRDINFDRGQGFRFGVEAEFILPFNKNKWGIVVEPTFQRYRQKTENFEAAIGGIIRSEVNYQSIEIPVGVRHYFFLNEKSAIFLDFAFVFFDFNTNSSINLSRNDGSLWYSPEIKSRINWAFGAGYKYADRFSFSMRYYTGRDILGSYKTLNSSYKTVSVILGYSLW